MTAGSILALVVLVALVASLPRWPWSRQWGNQAAILLAILLAAIVILIALQVL